MQDSDDFALHAWVDESMRQKAAPAPLYLLGAVVADPAQCDPAREQLRDILPKGAPKLHWSDMVDREKTRATAVVTSFDIAHLVVVGAPLDHRKQERARAHCMERLYWELGQMGVTTAFLEAREKSQRKKDLQLVDALRGKGTMPAGLRVEIGFPRDEPMLWIPDQVLGAMGDAEQAQSKWFAQYQGTVQRIDIEL
ncbi:hypothetical protein ACH9EU_08720 [Kocuria sp. M1R5S2]|uniref:hypothetical protein n=1 Tax=Kocuria rhizosphaerae TaxID=3376285 RepID=UPI003789FA28